MKTNEVFPSRYLKAEDDLFEAGDVVATIKSVELESLKSKDKGEESKPVMYFKEMPKGLIINKTNWGICAKLFGSDDSDDWLNQRVALTTVEVDAFGDVVKAIRIKSQKPAADKAALLKHYSALFEKAQKLGIKDITSVPADATEAQLLELGKALKLKVEAAEAFA
jgi:hypothetical protein